MDGVITSSTRRYFFLQSILPTKFTGGNTAEPWMRKKFVGIWALQRLELKANSHERPAFLAEVQRNIGWFVGVGYVEHRRHAVPELAPGWSAHEQLITTATE